MRIKKCKQYKGYYEIPGFSKYCINRKAEILHKRKNKHIKQFKNYSSFSSNLETECYMRVCMMNDEGKMVTPTVHRLVAITFKHPGKNVDITKLHVHHINHIKNDNRPENLEWLTCKENINDAKEFYRGRYHIPVQAYNPITKEVLNFSNISKCAKRFNLHRTTMIGRLFKYRPGFVFPEGYAFRLGNSEEPWEIDKDFHIEMETYHHTPILVKNTITNTVLECKNLREVSNLIPYSHSVLSTYINDETQPLILGKDGYPYLLIKKYSKRQFRKIPEPYIDLVERNKLYRLVVAYSCETGERRLYATVTDCANDFDILKTTLLWRLKAKTPRNYNGWCFRYYETMARVERNFHMHQPLIAKTILEEGYTKTKSEKISGKGLKS